MSLCFTLAALILAASAAHQPSLAGGSMISFASDVQAQAKPNSQPETPDAFLQRQMQRRHIPGMQVVIARHGQIILSRSFGVANLQDHTPVTKDTVFAIYSITKAFTGVAATQLIEQGKLDLTAPVSRYLDGLPSAWQPITIRQLLTHTSGLPNIVDNDTGGIIAPTEQSAWAKVLAMPLAFAPGERFSYCQTNYLLIGRIIDKLEILRLIKRNPHPTDRRRWLLHLMPAARSRLQQAGEYGDVTRGEALAGVSEDDRQHLLRTLETLKENLTQACDAPFAGQKRASHG